MKRYTFLLFVLCSVYVSTTVLSQSTEKIENFILTDVNTNSPVSLLDYKGSPGVVIIFTSHSCPYAKLYESRIHTLAKEFQGRGIQFLLINSNTSVDDNDDSIEQMAAIAKQKGYSFPYLADKAHKAAKMFGASKTPEAFVLQTTGDVFTLKYQGAIDDNPQMPSDVSAHYLREAVQAVLSKSNLSVGTRRATGCMIKKE